MQQQLQSRRLYYRKGCILQSLMMAALFLYLILCDIPYLQEIRLLMFISLLSFSSLILLIIYILGLEKYELTKIEQGSTWQLNIILIFCVIFLTLLFKIAFDYINVIDDSAVEWILSLPISMTVTIFVLVITFSYHEQELKRHNP